MCKILIIIISCHQTVFFHLSAHSLPVSLNSRRSSKVQGRVRVSIATSVPCFLLPVHIHTLCLHHSISISSVVLYCKCIQFSVDWGFSMWARGCCDPWLSLLLEELHRCVTSGAVLLSSSHTVQSLRRSPLVVHLAERVVLTSVAPVLGCVQTKSVFRLSFVWSSPLPHILLFWYLEGQFTQSNISPLR